MKLVLVQPLLTREASAENFERMERLLSPLAPALAPLDVVLLPEHAELRTSAAVYEDEVRALARQLGCHVVGGSHHEDRADGGRVNAGVACGPSGDVIGRYEKLRPYADERSAVRSGGTLGEFTVGSRRVLVLVCADFWFSDVFHRTTQLPDLVLVPAHSVSRKPTPEYSRTLWRNLAVGRAYEFGVYVGISDWAHAPVTDGRGLPASGVAGLADPSTHDPARLFRPVAGSAASYELDFSALDTFRRDRYVRGFFWKPSGA